MNNLDRVLTANPREFAALFGELTGDAATQPGTDTTGLQRLVAEVLSSRSISGGPEASAIASQQLPRSPLEANA
jgi:hypothetical protein